MSNRSTGKNLPPLAVFVYNNTPTRNWITGNTYTLALTPSLCIISILFPRCLPVYRRPQAKVAKQVAPTSPQVVKTLNVVYFPQLGGVTTASA